MENPSTEIICNHIVMAALSQVLLETIWELEHAEPLWKEKMRNLLPKMDKALHEKIAPMYKDDTASGKALQKEVLQCATEIKNGLDPYKKELIKMYGEANTER